MVTQAQDSRTATSAPNPVGLQIDVRGPRFSAALTFVVLVAAWVTQSTGLLAWQVAVFAVGALAGLRWSPYGNLFRFFKRRLNLGPPPATEPEAGPRFSQLAGLIFTAAGLGAVVSGRPGLGWTLVLVVVGLSGLLAVTGLCVGCEMHAAGRRVLGRDGRTVPTDASFSATELTGVGADPGALNFLLFTSPGCAPCSAARRVLEDAAVRHGAHVTAVDVTQHPRLAQDKLVRRAPTVFVVVPGGDAVARISGVPRHDAVDEVLTPAPALT